MNGGIFMRKFLSVLLSLFIFESLTLCVSADVIWMPYEDTFFDTYYEEILREDRTYVSPVELPFVVSPEDNSKTDYDPIPADEPFNVNFTYVDESGVLWGLVYIEMDNGAWVDLRGCTRPYDRKDFEKAYSDHFAPIVYQPDSSLYDNEVLLYDYPGAEKAIDTLIVDSNDTDLPAFAHTYTDKNGNVWAELYYYRQQSGWVLVEGDINTAVKPADAVDYIVGEISEKVTYQPYNSDDEIIENEKTETNATADSSSVENTSVNDISTVPADGNNKMLPALLVGAVVGITLIVLFVFFRKKKK